MCTYDQKVRKHLNIQKSRERINQLIQDEHALKNKNKNRERIHGISVDEGFFLGKKSLKLC